MYLSHFTYVFEHRYFRVYICIYTQCVPCINTGKVEFEVPVGQISSEIE